MKEHAVRRAGAMQWVYYMALGAGANYFTLYYKGLLLDGSGSPLYGVIGTIMLVQSLAAFISPLIAGYFADRYQITNRLISLCSFATSLSTGFIILAGLDLLPGLTLQGRLLLIFPGALLNNFFIRPLVPLLDTASLRALEDRDGNIDKYGRVRMMGSLGWILCCLLMGRWLDKTGELTHTLIFYAVSYAALGFISLGGVSTAVAKVKINWTYFFRDKTLRTLVVVSLGRMFGFGMAFLFTGVYLDELDMNYSQMGLVFGMAALLEVPVFFFGDRLLKRFGGKKLILADLALQIVRFGIFFFLPRMENPWFYASVQMMMGLGVCLHVTGVIPLLNRIAPLHLKATYQNIYSLSMATANIFTGITASFIVDVWGAGALMGICSLIMAVTLVYAVSRLHIPENH